MKTIRFLFALLIAFPLVGAENVTGPTFGTTANFVYAPVVASNGHGFLPLWTLFSAGPQVYGSTADRNGNVTTPNAFVAIPNASIERLFPFGDAYLAVIADANSGGTQRLAVIDNDGKLLRYGATVPATPSGYSGLRAFNGDEIFTPRFNAAPYPYELVGQITTLDGRTIRDNIALGPGSILVAVTNLGRNFVIATAEGNGIFVRWLSPDGSELRPKTRIASAPKNIVSIRVASSDANVAVAWNELDSSYSPGGSIYPAIVTPDSVVLGPRMPQPNVTNMDVVWSGAEYLILANNSIIARLSSTAAVVAEQGKAGTAQAAAGRVMFSARLTTTTAATSSRPEVIGASVSLNDSASISSDDILLSTTLRRQSTPILACDGLDCLSVWLDETGDVSRRSLMHISAAGVPVDTAQTDFAHQFPNTYPDPSARSIAFGRSVYLIVWQQGDDVVAQRFDPAGRAIDREPFLIKSSASVTAQAIAWNGSAFLVVWSESFGAPVNGSVSKNVNAAFVGETGGPTPVPMIAENADGPTIAWDGKRFLLTWQRLGAVGCSFDPCPLVGFETTMIRLGSDGKPIDPAPTSVDWFSLGLDARVPAYIASDGKEFILATDILPTRSVPTYAVAIVKIAADDPVISPSAPLILFRWMNQTASNILWDGNEFVVAWSYSDPLGQSRVGIERLGAGLTRGPQFFANTGATDAIDQPAIASTIPGSALLAISEVTSPGGIARIRTHTESEFTRAPAPPAPPLITSATESPNGMNVQWMTSTASAPADGFIVDRMFSDGSVASTMGTLPATARNAFLHTAIDKYLATYAQYVRIRAFNAAGVSEPSASVFLAPPPRNRAVRH